MATAQPDRRRPGEAASGRPGWPCSCAGTSGRWLGAVAGDAIGDPEAWGLDAAFPAGYVALAVPHLRTAPGRVAAAAGVAISLVLIPLAPAGVPIVAAARWASCRRSCSGPDCPRGRPQAMAVELGGRAGAGPGGLRLKALGLVVLGPRAVEGRSCAWPGCCPRRCCRRWWWSTRSPATAGWCSTPGPSAWPWPLVATWRQAPFVVVVAGAVAATALVTGAAPEAPREPCGVGDTGLPIEPRQNPAVAAGRCPRRPADHDRPTARGSGCAGQPAEAPGPGGATCRARTGRGPRFVEYRATRRPRRSATSWSRTTAGWRSFAPGGSPARASRWTTWSRWRRSAC